MDRKEGRRCGWCKSDPVYIQYHDEEWGREVTSDDKMFEFLVLESAQAGLSSSIPLQWPEATAYVNSLSMRAFIRYFV